jgi:hypothetical protein
MKKMCVSFICYRGNMNYISSFLANFGVGVSSRLRPLALENKVGIPVHWKVS